MKNLGLAIAKAKPKGPCVALVWVAFCFCLAAVFLLPRVLLAADFATIQNGAPFTIIHEVKVANPTNTAVKNLEIKVPLPDYEETLWQKPMGEDFSPKPVRITEDASGNRYAEYNIESLKANGKITLKHSYAVQNFTASFNVAGGSMEDYNYGLLPAKYTQPEKDIESNDATIMAYVKTLTEGDSNPYIIARRLFADINLYMTYDNSPRASRSAKAALSRGTGNCVDYCNLYIACLRAAGIPARIHSGYWYNSGGSINKDFYDADGLLKGDMLKHSWVEFYLPNQGWVVADPTFTYNVQVGDKSQKMVDWDHFASITKKNRLISTGVGNADNLKIDFTYQGGKPTITSDTRLAVYSTILPYRDLTDHWAAESVLDLRYWKVPVVTGIGNGLFGVNNGITRAELVAMINRILDATQPLEEKQIIDLGFKDVTSSYWAYADINKAVSRGLVQGFPDGNFMPNKQVDRAEMASILAKVAKLKKGGSSPFSDLDMPGYGWAKDSIVSLYNAQLASGVDATHFGPNKTLTRGEAAVFLDRWLKSSYYIY